MALPNLPITEKIYVIRNKYIITHNSNGVKVDNDLFATFPPTIHFYDLKKYKS